MTKVAPRRTLVLNDGGLSDDGLSLDVLGVFRRACLEQRFDVAEHLLRALEAMEGAEDDPQRSMAVAAAYRILASLPEA